MSAADVEKLRDEIRHEFSYVSRYLENTGGPTLKIHLARLRALLEPAPVDEREPSTSDVPAFYRPHRICVAHYTVSDHVEIAAGLLDRAASIMNELARIGAITQTEPSLTDEVARWFAGYDRLARS